MSSKFFCCLPLDFGAHFIGVVQLAGVAGGIAIAYLQDS